MKYLFSLLTTVAVALAISVSADAEKKTYKNPVIDKSCADPTIIKDGDTFYCYVTGYTIPIYSSKDLVNWKYEKEAFTKENRPELVPGQGIWAPGLFKIGDKYVMYYSMSRWGEHWVSTVGVATADSPLGPWKDCGELVQSEKIGVGNSIDPCFFSENGHNYLCWGSFYGLYLIELTADGTEILPGAEPLKLAGNAYEGSYLMKRGNYYYLFGSIGKCCRGNNSTYEVRVGRSKSLFGPYVDRHGKPMLENYDELVVKGDGSVRGPGHNSKIVKDAEGHDWMLYHGFEYEQPQKQRQLFLDRIYWRCGWPLIKGQHPSTEASAPQF